MNPFWVRRQIESLARKQLSHARGLEVCANLNQRGGRPLGTVWVWDGERRRPQLTWAWPSKS